MQAVQFTEHGGTDVIEYGEYGGIEPTENEVRVEIRAGALNHLDVWTRRGLPGLDLSMPHISGSDGAGVVDAVGDDVTRFNEGDRVAVSTGVSCGECEFCRDGERTMCVDFHLIGEHVRGVHAEHAVVPEENLVAVPRGVDWETAAAATWQDSLRSLAKGGRVVTCEATTGDSPETNINRIFWNQLQVIGSTMGTPGEVDDVLELVWDRTFEPRIREVLPMSETTHGHELLEEREGFGKVAVMPDRQYDR
jgi:NADPH:quinone reductase-like Zn-dependent oxidoreductase